MVPENKVRFLCMIVVSVLLISGFTAFLAHGYTTENEVEKNIEDDRNLPDQETSPMDSGGPDDGEYKWVNSTGSPSVSYNWKDAVTGGNATGLTDDDSTGPISLGFNFTYYGEVYNEVYIMSNGWVSFVDQDTWYQSEDFPGQTYYQGVISPYSEDLDPADEGEVYYKYISGTTDQFVITYYGVPYWGESNNQTFQVVFNETGEIWFNYQSLDDSLSYSANVGIENENSNIGLDYDSVASLSDGLSIKFEYDPPPYKVKLTPETQTDYSYSGTTVDYQLTVDNMGAENDTYNLTANNDTWRVDFFDMDNNSINSTHVLAGESSQFIGRVNIPSGANPGDHDLADINALSQNNGSVSDSASIKTEVLAPILLVDDDAGLNTEDWYMDALDANGYDYNYWNHSTQGTPSYSTLQNYNITIWFTGDSYGVNNPTLDSSDRNALGNYLDDNGRLYLSSSLAGYDANYYGWSDWFNSYLHSSYDDVFSNQPADMMGITGDPISDDLNLTVYQGDYNTDLYGYTTEISPQHQGRVSYINTTNSFNSTIRADTGVYKTVHTSFDFAGVKGQGNRTNLMYRIIEWLNQSASDNISPDAPINPSPPDGATGVSTSPTLSVDVSDPDGDWMDVTFYDASYDTEIGQNTAVTNGTTSITWPGLATNTTYTWYAVVDDGLNSTQSSTWTFTTRESSQNEAPSAPHNPNPADGATGVSISPTLSVDVSDPDGDTMDVRFIDASDNILIGSNTGVTNGTTSITWSGLSENTDYQWYAIADDEGSETEVISSTWTFTTIGSGENEGPSAPYNPDPTDGATGLNLNPTLSVNVSDPNGDTMDVTFYDASDSSVIGSNTMASNGTTSVMWSGLSEGMSYEWYATADDGEFNVTSSMWRFTTITSSENEGPSAPHNPDPADGATGVSLSPTLTVDVSDPDGHEMIVTFYNSFGTEIDRRTGVTNGTCSVTWDGLDYNTDHSWYVVANDSIEENQSAVWTFQTMEDTTPPSVSINSPSEDSEVSNTSVTVEWTASDSDSGVDHYEIKLNDGEWIEVDGDTTYTFDGLSEGSHTVEVKAVDGEGNSATDSVAFVVEKGDESSTDITLFSYWWLLIILAVVVILILAVWHRRKKRPPEYQQPPGQQQQVPQQQQQPPQQEQPPPPSEKQGGKGETPPPPPPES